MDLKEKAIKSVAWSTVQKWGFRFISLLIFVFLARILKPEDFGLMAYASVFIVFVQLFIDMSFSQAIVQRDKLESDHINTAFWISLLGGITLTVVSIASAGFISDVLNEPRLKPIIQWLSLSFLFGSISIIPQAYLQRTMDFRTLAIRWLLAVIVGGIVGIGMALKGFGVWSLVGQNISQSAIGVIVLWTTRKWRLKFVISLKHLRELFDFGMYILGAEIINFFNNRGIDFLIGYFLGPIALGYFNVGRKVLFTLRDIFIGSIGQVALPAFSKLQNDNDRLKKAFYFATQMMSLIAFPAFFGIAAVTPELVQALFGDHWYPSIPIMRVLAFIGILRSVYFFNGIVLKAIGKPFLILCLSILNAAASIVAFSIAVRWGIVAVATAFVIRGYLLAPIPLLIVRKFIRINLITYLRQLLAPLIGCFTMVSAVLGSKLLLHSIKDIHLLVASEVFLGAIVYILTILLISPSLFSRASDIVRLAVPRSFYQRTPER